MALPLLASACLIFGIFTVACHTLYHLHRVSFARTVLASLRHPRDRVPDGRAAAAA